MATHCRITGLVVLAGVFACRSTPTASRPCQPLRAVVAANQTVLTPGDTVRLTATVIIAAVVDSACPSPEPIVRWTSSDTTVVVVDSVEGLAHALRVGKATITAVDRGGSRQLGTVTLTVQTP